MANNDMKRYSVALAIRKIQIKTTLQDDFRTTRIAIIKKGKIKNIIKVLRNWNPHILMGRI